MLKKNLQLSLQLLLACFHTASKVKLPAYRAEMTASSTSAGWLKGYAVAIASLLSGAAVVHNIYKPDLVRLRVQPCFE